MLCQSTEPNQFTVLFVLIALIGCNRGEHTVAALTLMGVLYSKRMGAEPLRLNGLMGVLLSREVVFWSVLI